MLCVLFMFMSVLASLLGIPPLTLSFYLLVELVLTKPSSKCLAAEGSFSVPGDCQAPCPHCTLLPVVPVDLSCWKLGLACDFRCLGVCCCRRLRAVISECMRVGVGGGRMKGGAVVRLGRRTGWQSTVDGDMQTFKEGPLPGRCSGPEPVPENVALLPTIFRKAQP